MPGMFSSIAEARGHLPGAEIERVRSTPPASRTRSAIADRAGVVVGAASPAARRIGIDDQVHRALAVEHHLARAMARHRHEAHRLQQPAERLRLRRRVLDELDAVQAERVRGLGMVLADRHAVLGPQGLLVLRRS